MSASLGYSRYTDNRNRWRKVIGYERQSPSPLTFVDKDTNTNYTLDLNKTNRDRNFFSVEDRDAYILPNQINDCCLWLRADLGISSSGTNNNIVTWRDQVSGTVFVPSGSFATPFFSTVSGVAAVTLPGSSSLTSSTNIALYGSQIINAFFVFMPTAPTSDTTIYRAVAGTEQYENGARAAAWQLLVRTDGFRNWVPQYRSGSVGVSGESSANNNIVVLGRMNKYFFKINTITTPIQSGSFFFDGSICTTTSGSTLLTSGNIGFSNTSASGSRPFPDYPFHIGANHLGSALRPFSGSIFEIIVYNRNLTPEEYTMVNGYLSWRYSLPV